MIYDLLIRLYVFAIRIYAVFNPKAKLWLKGRKDIFHKLENDFKNNEAPVAWFHCASLGEFEQGRPLIEKFKEINKEYKILLTFFSPSGYEIRKNYKDADYIFYLPADTYYNAKRFINITNPKIVFFVKYEFWKNYLTIIKSRDIPLYLVSAIFRANQRFFKKHGVGARKLLTLFSTIFVQDENSNKLLKQIPNLNVITAGDTRFDRVYQTAISAPENKLIEKFCENSKVLICGSSWLPDEEIISKIMNSGKHKLKYIIVPHEIDSQHISSLQKLLNQPSTLYTKAKMDSISNILIVDTIGILSQIYRYTNYAYIGGGFGVGIHNILEAATFGKPIFFGPNYRKFKEANDLIALGGAISINNVDELNTQIELLENNEGEYQKRCQITKAFVNDNIGATAKIIHNL